MGGAVKRLRHAIAMTFWIYVVTTLVALVPTLAGLSTLSLPGAADYAGGAGMLEAFEEAKSGITATTVVTILLAGLMWLLSPLLQMAWLSALERPRSVSQSLGLGAQRYLRAVAVSLVMAVPLLVAVVLLAAPPVIGHLVLADHPNARTHDLVVAALVAPGLFLVATWAAWHDVARAELAAGRSRPLDAVRAAWRHLHGRTIGLYVGWFLLAGVASALGHALGGWLDGSIFWQALVLLVLVQVLAVARVACRGAWLGAAMDLTAPLMHRPAEDHTRP